MKKKFTWIFILATLGALCLVYFSNLKIFRSHLTSDHPTSVKKTGFIQSKWGASPQEVEAADQVTLQTSESYRKFYSVKEEIKDTSRYKALYADSKEFLGHKARISYVFFDNKLYTYHVFIQGSDPAELDSLMRKYLVENFGNTFVSVDDEASPLKLVWNQPTEFINYWFFKEPLSISLEDKFSAGFGVVYRPLEDSIKN